MKKLLPTILKHAKTEIPNEACGVVVQVGSTTEYIPCTNISPTPHLDFVICPKDFAKCSNVGKIILIVHSHQDNCQASEYDITACNLGNTPWLVMNASTGEYSKISPSGVKVPLIGRPFLHGILDCYSLIRDYYSETLGITLTDYYREDDWWDNGKNYYLDLANTENFYRVPIEDIKVHDLIFMQIHSNVPNHAAIYLGEGNILHHVSNRLSRRDYFEGYWAKHTHSVYRYNRDGTN